MKKLVEAIDKQLNFMYNVLVYLCARQGIHPKDTLFPS